jgi:hypothetical protein
MAQTNVVWIPPEGVGLRIRSVIQLVAGLPCNGRQRMVPGWDAVTPVSGHTVVYFLVTTITPSCFVEFRTEIVHDARWTGAANRIVPMSRTEIVR